LLNHWQPLLRLLRSVRRPFEASVVPEEPVTVEVKDLDGLRRRARRLGDDGQWVAALEAWAQLLRGSAGPDGRQEALFGRVKALEGQGEQFLAERMLRALLLFEADEGVQAEAADRLARTYARARDPDALLALFAVYLQRHPTPAALASFAQALLE